MNQINNDNLPVITEKKLFYLVAGESSGDILGARLIEALKIHYPKAEFSGIGGPLMLAAGLKSFYPMERLSVMGIAPILVRLPELVKMRRRLAKTILEHKADCFIGIDAPVFNTDLEFKLKNKGITTVHYVSPSVWAWRENRIFKIVKSVSLMICLFPFELEIYKTHHLPAVCIGHPLAEEIPLQTDTNSIRQQLDLPQGKKILAILPGSRGSETKFLLEPFIQTAENLARKYPQLCFVIPCANSKRRTQIEEYLQQHQTDIDIRLFDGQSREIMQASDYILLASGTATLEAMLFKRPMVVAYKVSAFSYWVYSKLLKIKSFSLPNLLAKKKLVSEFIQDDCTVEALTAELSGLIESQSLNKITSEFNQLHQNLRLGGSAKAAKAIRNLLESDFLESDLLKSDLLKSDLLESDPLEPESNHV